MEYVVEAFELAIHILSTSESQIMIWIVSWLRNYPNKHNLQENGARTILQR